MRKTQWKAQICTEGQGEQESWWENRASLHYSLVGWGQMVASSRGNRGGRGVLRGTAELCVCQSR